MLTNTSTMPISDDDFDSRPSYDEEQQQPRGLTKAELRKTNKPIMEKKRRARINQCLNELKDLILEAMKKDPARHSKLEKADILEMTVRHLQSIQRSSLSSAAASDPAVLPRFRQGFAECAAEATRFLSKPPGLPPPARSRLRQHLAACVAALNHPQGGNIPHDFNGNIHVGGVPLIPSRLPTGELALLVPASSQLSQPLSELITQKAHASAFQAVRTGRRPPSPSSSVSSCDSMSSERATPPQITIGETFPTPPSQSSFTDSSPETQRPTVSSTTISPDTKILEKRVQEPWKGLLTPPSINTSSEIESDKSVIEISYSSTPVIAKKRYYPSDNPNRLLKISAEEPPKKIWKIACTQVSSSQSPSRSPGARGESSSSSNATGSSTSKDNMWRPW